MNHTVNCQANKYEATSFGHIVAVVVVVKWLEITQKIVGPILDLTAIFIIDLYPSEIWSKCEMSASSNSQ